MKLPNISSIGARWSLWIVWEIHFTLLGMWILIHDDTKLIQVSKKRTFWPISRTIFHHMFIIRWKFCVCVWNSIIRHHIATKFCTCHDCTAVVPCTNYNSGHFITTWMRVEWTFHRMWITMENRSWNGLLVHIWVFVNKLWPQQHDNHLADGIFKCIPLNKNVLNFK